jgi:RNA polymerase sigma-70 factor, ECF subfamily
MQPDAVLVESVLSGDRAAYDELVCRYSQCVVATAWQILGDYHAAQDVAQEAFLIAYQKLGSLRNGSTFGSWVLKIARRYACRSARHMARAVQLEAGNAHPSPSRDDRLTDDQEELLAAVARLPEHERVVLVLHYFQEHSVKAVAEATQRPLGTVTKQLSRALRRLRNSIAATNCQKEL